MLFNSYEFLIFFPLVTFLYFFLPHTLRIFLLLIASCIFYMALIPAYILIIFLTIIVDYSAGILIARSKKGWRKIFLIISILSNLGILFYFKYINFFLSDILITIKIFPISNPPPHLDILLPLGLSFHTFQALSYTIEVYKKKQKPEKNFFVYALYVMFFPQLVAGPIERPQNLLPQFREKHYFEYERVTNGLKLMTWGFFKKIVIADNIGAYVDMIYGNPYPHQGITLLFATFLFAYQIFCDFSGYSDIAIGSAQILGFRLMKNFDRPYFSSSISEFWTRWHISLSTWLRDYVYIPLGGNRVSFSRWQINILITFLASGLWHGANWTFIVWGGLHGSYIIISRWINYLKQRFIPHIHLNNWKLTRMAKIILTFTLVCFAWIFFRAKNITDALYISSHLFKGINTYVYDIYHYYRTFNSFPFETILNPILLNKTPQDMAVIIVAIIILETVHIIQRKNSISIFLSKKPLPVRWAMYIALLWIIVIFGNFGKRDFIYFAF